MVISSLEYKSLFNDKDINEVTIEDIINKRKERAATEAAEAKKTAPDFTTYKEVGIVFDEWGNRSVGIVERTGFEMEGN